MLVFIINDNNIVSSFRLDVVAGATDHSQVQRHSLLTF